MSTPINDINNVHQDQLYLYFYEDDLTQIRTEKECNFILKHCGITKKHRILDLACGHGRHSNFLANIKYDVLGIDINSKFIELAKEEAKDKKNKAVFEENDILQINYNKEFNSILLLSNTLGFLNKQDCDQLFNKISKALKFGGKVLIDIKNRDHFINEIVPANVLEKNKDLMIDRISFNPIEGTAINNRIYVKNGKRYDTPFKMYLYNYSDLNEMATKNHLTIMKQFGGWDGQEFNANSKRIILILEKIKSIESLNKAK